MTKRRSMLPRAERHPNKPSQLTNIFEAISGLFPKGRGSQQKLADSNANSLNRLVFLVKLHSKSREAFPPVERRLFVTTSTSKPSTKVYRKELESMSFPHLTDIFEVDESGFDLTVFVDTSDKILGRRAMQVSIPDTQEFPLSSRFLGFQKTKVSDQAERVAIEADVSTKTIEFESNLLQEQFSMLHSVFHRYVPKDLNTEELALVRKNCEIMLTLEWETRTEREATSHDLDCKTETSLVKDPQGGEVMTSKSVFSKDDLRLIDKLRALGCACEIINDPSSLKDRGVIEDRFTDMLILSLDSKPTTFESARCFVIANRDETKFGNDYQKLVDSLSQSELARLSVIEFPSYSTDEEVVFF